MVTPSKKAKSIALLQEWVDINSFSYNPEGLLAMRASLERAFSSLKASFRARKLVFPMEKSALLVWEKRKKAPIQILFGGHYDTVFPPHSSFKKMTWLSKTKVSGPGVLDMKGGILILLLLLEKIEASPWKEKVGWKVLLNPDEEIGSIASKPLLFEESSGYDFALWFEPAPSEDALIDRRAGSLNLEVAMQGKKAHVGRDFQEGRSAIKGLVSLLHKIQNKKGTSFRLNIGKIMGGEGYNTVSDSATAWINFRSFSKMELVKFEESVKKIGEEVGTNMELFFFLRRFSFRPPSAYTKASRRLFREYTHFAKTEGMILKLKKSFGVTDSSSIDEIPCIDTLGGVGKGLHTEDEWLDVESLFKRIDSTYQFIEKKVLQ